MELTLKAILARFSGDREAAIQYCYGIIDQYPHLRDEYTALADRLVGHEEKAKAANASA